MEIKYLSLFSGVEAASLAWEELGFKPMAFAEIEPFPSAVLAERWPGVPNLGDVTAVDWDEWLKENGRPDVMVAGAPCQAFSVAGQRRSLNDVRGNLTLFTAELVRFLNPRVFLFENVPGLLSSRDNAFGCLLGELVGAGEPLKPTGKRWTDAGLVSGPEARIAWRVLDAQYVGVAQRRKRVFVARCPRDGTDPLALLSQPEGLQRYLAPSRPKRSGVAALTATGVGTCGADDNQAQGGRLIPDVAGTIGNAHASFRFDLDGSGAFIPEEQPPMVMASGQHNAEIGDDLCPAQAARQYKDPPIMFKVRGGAAENTGEQGGDVGKAAGKGYLGQEDAAFTVASTQDQWLAEPVCFKPSHYTRGKDGAPNEVCPPLMKEDDRGDQEPVVLAYRKSQRAHSADDCETWVDDGVANTLNAFEDHCDARATHTVVEGMANFMGAKGSGLVQEGDQPSYTLNAMHGSNDVHVIFTSDGETADPVGANEARTYTNEGAHNFRMHNVVGEPLSLASRTRDGEKNIEWQEGVAHALTNPGDGGRRDAGMVLAPEEEPVAGFKTGQSVRGTFAYSEEQSPTLEGGGGGNNKPALHYGMAVRRLTPTECERLQGMPDGHTLVPWRGKAAEDCPDGPRYKAIGNSMAVPVMRWIGRRIATVLEEEPCS